MQLNSEKMRILLILLLMSSMCKGQSLDEDRILTVKSFVTEFQKQKISPKKIADNYMEFESGVAVSGDKYKKLETMIEYLKKESGCDTCQGGAVDFKKEKIEIISLKNRSAENVHLTKTDISDVYILWKNGRPMKFFLFRNRRIISFFLLSSQYQSTFIGVD